MGARQTTKFVDHEPAETGLKAGSIGVLGIVMFVMGAQAPLVGLAGASPLAVGLGNGAAAPAAYLLVGLVIIIFAVGFTVMNRKVRLPGAFFAYVTAGLGERTGTGASLLALLAYSSIQAAMYGMLGAATAGLIFGLTGALIPWWLIVLVAIAFVLLLGTRSVEAGTRFVTTLVVIEFALIFLFVGGALLTGGGPEGLNLAASFSPLTFFAGAPGIAIMFAVASMFGFEQTAIYSSEAKDPIKTVVRATYASVAIIALFFAFVMWILVSHYGYSGVVDAAFAALESEDPTQFLFGPISAVLGSWAGLLGQILLTTSLLVGIVAFHNTVNRYLHALAQASVLPGGLSRTNKYHAPQNAAFLQTGIALVIVVPFMVLRLEPVSTLFSWFSGLAVASLLVLYIVTSLAIVLFLRRAAEPVSIWKSTIAPITAGVGFLFFFTLVVGNFPELIGGNVVTAVSLLVVVPVVYVLGVLLGSRTGVSNS